MKFEFRMSVQLNPSVSLGESSTGGKQTWTTISGGTWSGTFGSGTVVVRSFNPFFLLELWITDLLSLVDKTTAPTAPPR